MSNDVGDDDLDGDKDFIAEFVHALPKLSKLAGDRQGWP
jgi:hypothetical protein